MGLPNKISIFRLLLVPAIFILIVIYPFGGICSWNINLPAITISNYTLPITWLIAGILFIIASLTDFLDGYIARKYNQVTTSGKFLDAIADKVLTNLTLFAFVCEGIVPFWLLAIFMIRDLIVDALRQTLASKNVIWPAQQLGKWKTACMMVGTTLLFFISSAHLGVNLYNWESQLILIPLYISGILSVVSGMQYLINNWNKVFNEKEEKK
ncbi:CDP-diacylglycerol--glycerol-3-phosphate 3-phosphatidyltransferase [Spiroplasma endosymbiont of Amphibalanus improvisus]|uniref:CDP-diacylglycerol--glycerol-3-phosphate 3-phosphatidyltransferase n=1 Tax=Spiroplasma endosymbiont of Amphibalanus improvisus TaxID=3066327 RepID=UPI00313E8765